MANRHLSRSIVLQSLFEWDFFNLKPQEVKAVVERNAKEFAPGMKDITFAENLALEVINKKKDLDLIIEKAAPDWPIDKINGVDRNVLRVGLCELLFSDREEVPPKVAINEAIELAKTFGGETSGKFVNGVLGAVYKEMGEPGKDQQSNKGLKGKKNSLDDQNLPLEQLGGAVVYAEDNGKMYVALVHDVFGHWTLSKGKLEGEEEVKDGTEREIKEEIGLDIKIKDDLGVNEYIAYHPEKGKLRKRVHYFLAEAEFLPLKLESSGGLDDARWFTISDIVDLNFYDDVLPLITKAVTILAERYGSK